MRKSRVKAEGEHVNHDPDGDPKVMVTKRKARMTAGPRRKALLQATATLLTQVVSTFQLLFNKWRMNLVVSSPSAQEHNGLEHWFTTCGSCPTHPAY